MVPSLIAGQTYARQSTSSFPHAWFKNMPAFLFQRCHLPRAVLTPTSCVCSAELPSFPDRNLPQSPRAMHQPLPSLRSLPSSSVLYILCLRDVACSPPNPGRRGFSCLLSFQGRISQVYCLAWNIGKITEGNHVWGNLFSLPKLINTTPPLVW